MPGTALIVIDMITAYEHPVASPDRSVPTPTRFVVKARHSVFHGTPLACLLGRLEVRRLVLCGQVTEECVLYSALHAHIRHLADAAPRMMEVTMGAEILRADQVVF